ncbi:MAG: NAD(P)-dependent oxidoreductase, partial [Gammaproteobacteria bacterium]|nr:NAD(P)-dependent oxidoreductase [Gammaproteobacteria bacterium]
MVITMLAHDQALEEVTRGAGGLLVSLPKGAIHVAMGTHSVIVTREISRAHAGAGQVFVAAPVQADRTGDSMKEIISELTAYLKTKGTTDEELTRVVNGNVRRLPGSFETTGAVFGGVITLAN